MIEPELGLASPLFAVLLAVIGLWGIFASVWINAVDVALSRMSLAYAEDLREEGRKNAVALESALLMRKHATLALLVPRGTLQTLGVLFLSVMLFAQFHHLGMPWWLNMVLTAVVVGVVEAAAITVLAVLLSGDRYVWVALRGAPLADRLYRLAAPTKRTRRNGSERLRIEKSQRLSVADELRELVDEVSEGNPADLEEEDRQILRSVFELGQTRIGEVMVPRGDMVLIHAEETATEAVDLFLQSGFSRIPVIGRNTDDVLGILYFKDVVRRLRESESAAKTRAVDMMRQSAFVPEMKLADDELRVMQTTNSHLALVVDEYGGIAGLVTAEDIIEELIGELTDEHDHPATTPEQVSEHEWLFPAAFSLDDFAEQTGLKIDEEDVYSVGGLLAKELGKVPLPGDRAEIPGAVLIAGQEVGRRHQIKWVTTQLVPTVGTEEGELEQRD